MQVDDDTGPAVDNVPIKIEEDEVEKTENKDENGNQSETNENSIDTGLVSVIILITSSPSDTTVTTPPSNYHHDDTHLVDPCDIDGCGRGGGIIVVGVVGLIAFLVVFFVGVVVIRRLYLNRQKKHYHNVDYLINGMYT